MNEMIPVASFNERNKAEILERRFREAGVEVRVDDESAIQRSRLFAPKPMAQMKVEVAKPDMDRAMKLLAEWEPQGVLSGAVRCPECHSARVQYPQFTRNFLLPNVLAGALWWLRLVPAEFYCEECQFTWPPEPPKEAPELDTLNWPKDSTKSGPIGPR
jgi:Zn finger protein HypA/HybF involved in hydrogenase expression